MIRKFASIERHTTDLGWLRSQPLYSFGDYQNDARSGFSVMRVCNDDYLAPGRGFGAHPHSDMEIVSIVLSGRIHHEDNLGNDVVTGFGEVQRMSAGSGIIHAEFNASEEEELRLLQLWFMPREKGMKPDYEAKRFDISKLHNRLLPVISSDLKGEEIAAINQDMTIYLSKLEAGQSLSFETNANRRLFLYSIEGELNVLGEQLAANDTAELEGETALTLECSQDTFFMLIDMP